MEVEGVLSEAEVLEVLKNALAFYKANSKKVHHGKILLNGILHSYFTIAIFS